MALTDKQKKEKEKARWDKLTNKQKIAEVKKLNAEQNAKTAKQKEETKNKAAIAKYGFVPETFVEQHKRHNPHLYNAKGEFSPPQASLLGEAPEWNERIANKLPEQEQFLLSLLPQVQQHLPSLLKNLSTLPAQDMFGHMNNPVLQGLMGNLGGYNPNTIFPSQMQTQMNPGIEMLLGQLGQQGGQYLGEQIPEWWKSAQKQAPALYEGAKGLGGQALQYGQQVGGNVIDLLSGLVNRFRTPQQPQP